MRTHPRAGPALPPDPPIALGPHDADLVERATLALGRLDGVALLVPDPKLHAWLALRREAVLSCHVEGVGPKVSTTELIRHEDVGGAGAEGALEVAATSAALGLGVARIRGGCTLTTGLLAELHAVLRPGDEALRTGGGAPPDRRTWSPPPPDVVPTGLADLEVFLRGHTPVLIRIAVGLAHVENLQ